MTPDSSTTLSAHAILYPASQEASFLRNIDMAIDEALSGIQRFEGVWGHSAELNQEGSLLAETLDSGECTRQLSVSVEDKFQITRDVNQVFEMNTSHPQLATGAIARNVPKSHARKRPRREITVDDYDPAPAGVLLPLVFPGSSRGHTTVDENVYYTPPMVHGPVNANGPPALLPAVDLSAEYEAIIERRLRRRLSYDTRRKEPVIRCSPQKRRKCGRVRRPSQPNAQTCGNGLLDPVLAIFRW